MNTKQILRNRKSQSGQTLIIAILVLSVLLILGFVFIGIISRNINQSERSKQRSIGVDLAKAGVEYAHKQLSDSELRADWRPAPVPLAAAGDITRDPDALYLRQASGFPLRNAADTLVDKGGPDGLGPFGRQPFSTGRALIRVRYGPSDASLFTVGAVGALREPGKAKNYLIIEVIGRPGQINGSDPTTQLANGGVKFQNYANEAEFRANFSLMHERDAQFQSSRKLIAFAAVGIIDNALFISDRENTSRTAQFGFDGASGANYNGVNVQPTIQLGSSADGPGAATVSGGGSIWCNTDLSLFGNTSLILNQGLGDGIRVAGKLKAGDAFAQLFILRTVGDDSVTADNSSILLSQTAGSVNAVPTTDRLDSDWPLFGTVDGLIRDGIQATDPKGQPRSIGRMEPPVFTEVDPVNNVNSYVTITRNSGSIVNGRNSGNFAIGRNIYVNNTDDRQMGADENAREDVGSEQSLTYDWLNPNNGQNGSGWQGPFYVPVGAYVRLTYDGFYITRDGRAPAARRTWRRADGSDTGLTTARFRIGGDPDGPGPLPPYIISTMTNPADINAVNPVWTNGFPFEGVLYFEGNVRVKGTIPTDVQLTLLSMATIYIEGSITKGIYTDAVGTRLTRPSRSSLMLMAKDYVALNTTQFLGTPPAQTLEEVDEDPSAPNPVRVGTGSSLVLNFDLPFRTTNVVGLPGVTPTNPASYRPYAQDYVDPQTNNPIVSQLLLSHATDGTSGFTTIGADINYGIPNSVYNFLDIANGNPAAYGTRKVLGVEDYGKALKFETIGFPIIDPASATWAGNSVTATTAIGSYTMFLAASNDLALTVFNDMPSFAPGQAYKVRRAAVVPADIRIEASVYAQDGAFFVIPGSWFNPNPNDRRDTYPSLGLTQAERDANRLAQFGSYPETPFYGEPLDVKVQIIGSVSMNMPVPISQQSEYLKKWGWIPREQGVTGRLIPSAHVPQGFNITNAGGDQYVPNLIISYDPMLATGRTSGYRDIPNSYVRYSRVTPDPVNNPGFSVDYPLAPMPRLPVSPTLAYYGEVNP